MILDLWISLPRFHSHCFSSPLFELRACWVPFCESVLPSINRPRAEISVISAWARPNGAVTEVRYSILDLVGSSASPIRSSLWTFRSSSRRFLRNPSQWLVDLLGNPDPMHQNYQLPRYRYDCSLLGVLATPRCQRYSPPS